MKKEKIILKKGDKVYYINIFGTEDFIIVDAFSGHTIKEFEEINNGKITKIERNIAKYETIYEAPKPILDKEEKEYLEAVLRPFKKKVKFITKINDLFGIRQFIMIRLSTDNDGISLPFFKKGTMYKGMELSKQYTLAELGLFEGE